MRQGEGGVELRDIGAGVAVVLELAEGEEVVLNSAETIETPTVGGDALGELDLHGSFGREILHETFRESVVGGAILVGHRGDLAGDAVAARVHAGALFACIGDEALWERRARCCGSLLIACRKSILDTSQTSPIERYYGAPGNGVHGLRRAGMGWVLGWCRDWGCGNFRFVFAGCERRVTLINAEGTRRMSFFRDLRVAFHSLMRSKGLAVIVTLTLALGIGANAAIFTLVRGVLLKPLVNRDENRLMYIRQSAPRIGDDNTTFSVPEIKDIEASVHSVSEFGDFSTMSFTMIGLGEPRGVQGGVVGGSYFEVMGLRPVLGRLIGPQDDGPNAAGVIVLTYRFWSTVFKKDPGVIGKTVRLSSIGDRSATVIGVLEPSVPYPADTEIIGNVVTSPHHLSATMVTGRVHRMTELFGKLAPGATLDRARAELRTVYASMRKDQPDAYPDSGGYRIDARGCSGTRLLPARAPFSSSFSLPPGPRLHHRVLERCQPDSCAYGSPRGRTLHPCRARRKHLGAASHAVSRKPSALRRGRGNRRNDRAAIESQSWHDTPRASPFARWI